MTTEQSYSSSSSSTANGVASGNSEHKAAGSNIDRAKTIAHETLDKACDKVRPALDNAFSAAHSAVDGAAERAKYAAESLSAGTEKVTNLQHQLAENIRHYIQDKPLTAMGIAVSAGVLLSSILRKD